MKTRKLTTGAVALVAATMSTAATVHHITPTVVLTEQADVIRHTLDGAKSYFVRTVELGKDDVDRIAEEVSFKPDDPEFKFYYGTDTAEHTVGVVLFPQANTQHGPVEVGLTIGSDGRVMAATVTKATVETKPWVLEAVDEGLMEGFVGMRYGDDPDRALEGLSKDELGAMPYYFARVTARAVKSGLVIHHVLYEAQ